MERFYVGVMSSRGDHCHDGGQLCKERRISPAARRVPSLYFTAPLSHIVPFRAQTVYPPCSVHPTIVRASWFEKPSGFFFFFCKQVKAICICFSLQDLTGRLRQADIEHAKGGGFPLHRHLHHPLVFLCWPLSFCLFPRFPRFCAIQQYSLFLLENTNRSIIMTSVLPHECIKLIKQRVK